MSAIYRTANLSEMVRVKLSHAKSGQSVSFLECKADVKINSDENNCKI